MEEEKIGRGGDGANSRREEKMVGNREEIDNNLKREKYTFELL